ncbi:condensation domain-containing protein [Streptomyces sp. NPDC088124]|uniref:condensation domain-containing protein n=1 Tax=Streptomyces sp. NPDC088124 TaxID=3154654 RepID=UPI003442EC37
MRHEMSLFQRVAMQTEKIRPGYLTNPRATLNIVVDISGPLDTDVLGAAFRELVERNETLRARPIPDSTRTEAVPGADGVELRPVESSGSPEQDAERLAALLQETRIDIDAPPLVRGHLVATGARRHLLGLVFHHFAVDPSSLRHALAELCGLYTALLAGRELPPVPLPYSQYAQWQNKRLTERAAADRAGWQRALGDLPVPVYRRDTPFRPSAPVNGRVLRMEVLGDTRTEAVLDWSRVHRSTVFTTLLAAYGLALRSRAETDDLVVASVFEQRDHPGVRKLVGPFVYPTLLPLRVRPGGLTAEYVGEVRSAVIEAYGRAQFPVVELLGLAPQFAPGVLGTAPSWFRMFEYLPSRDTVPYAFGAALGTVTHSAGNQAEANHFGQFMRVRRAPDGALMGRIGYDANDMTEDSVLAFVDDFRGHLTSLVTRRTAAPAHR